MTPKPDFKTDSKRSERWIDGIRDLARRRGDGDAVWQRAVALTRELNIAPWLALAVAERLVSLQDARILDRAGKCEELQAAVLDQRKPLSELRTTLPYAPYLLAVDLVERLGRADWELRKVTSVAEGLLNQEKRVGEEGSLLPVRTRSLDDYVAAVKRVRRLVEVTGCNLRMALDVEAGRLTEDYVQQYTRQRRRLVREEGLQDATSSPRSRPGFPPRAGGSAPVGRYPSRRPEMGDARTPRS
jgi:hypothetical protein